VFDVVILIDTREKGSRRRKGTKRTADKNVKQQRKEKKRGGNEKTRGGRKQGKRNETRTGSIIIFHHSPCMDELERILGEMRVLREGTPNDA
jgi:hypothetical protein